METENKQVCTYSNSKAMMLPVFDALDALKGRWRLPILISLISGNKRFSQVSKDVIGISDKILAKELKELESNQLIKRTVYNTFPPTVDYAITQHGKSVERLVVELKDWGEKHRKQVISR